MNNSAAYTLAERALQALETTDRDPRALIGDDLQPLNGSERYDQRATTLATIAMAISAHETTDMLERLAALVERHGEQLTEISEQLAVTNRNLTALADIDDRLAATNETISLGMASLVDVQEETFLERLFRRLWRRVFPRRPPSWPTWSSPNVMPTPHDSPDGALQRIGL